MAVTLFWDQTCLNRARPVTFQKGCGRGPRAMHTHLGVRLSPERRKRSNEMQMHPNGQRGRLSPTAGTRTYSSRWRGSSEGTTRAECHLLHPCLPQSLRRPAAPQVSISTGQEAEPTVCLGPTSQQDGQGRPRLRAAGTGVSRQGGSPLNISPNGPPRSESGSPQGSRLARFVPGGWASCRSLGQAAGASADGSRLPDPSRAPSSAALKPASGPSTGSG